MVDARKIVGSSWMKKEDLDGETVLTISEWSEAEMEDDSGDIEVVLALSFEESRKKLRVNTTNMNRIADLFDTFETDNWIGKQIILFHDPKVEMKGKKVGGIRVKEELPRPKRKRSTTRRRSTRK